MKKFLLFVFAMLVLAAMTMGMGSKEAPESHSKAKTGITGKVEIWEGDFMPMSDQKSGRNKITPGSGRRVRVHKPVKMSMAGSSAKLDSVPTPLVGEAISDKDGRFFVPVNPGIYSVYVEEDSGWYFNGWGGDGIQGEVKVDSGETSEVLIKITTKATF